MKRFYDRVDTEHRDGGFAVLLDGRTIKTPGGQRLSVPAADLGHAIAAEWAAQTETVRPQTMPFTRFANTVIDGIAPDPSGVAEAVLGVFANDLLCYRAEEPEGLVARQEKAWAPVLAWAGREWGIDLTVTTGVMPCVQPATTRLAAEAWVGRLDPFSLGAVHMAATLTASGVLALALAEGHLAAATVWSLSRIDEDWQIARWGEDEEAAERAALRRRELANAANILQWMRTDPDHSRE